MAEVLRTLALLPEKGSIRGVARATGHDKNAIYHEGDRTTEDAIDLFRDAERRRAFILRFLYSHLITGIRLKRDL
jgi:hypothetical protein